MNKILSLFLAALTLSLVGCSVFLGDVKTEKCKDVTMNSALLQGKLRIELTKYDKVEFGILLSELEDEIEDYKGQKLYAQALMNQSFEVEANGLKPATDYYYCAWVLLNNTQYKFGRIKRFTTDSSNSGQQNAMGVFSVSPSTKVGFSPGNLQYDESTNSWTFAKEQWESVDDRHLIDRKKDLLGWSANSASARYGVSTSTNNNDYSGSFADWGQNSIDGGAPNTWRTLTSSEWNYLLFERPNAASLMGVARVNGYNGLVILPDNWKCPSGIVFRPGFAKEYNIIAYSQHQSYTDTEWYKLEQAGAVFLPAAGTRSGKDIDNEQDYGRYWSATSNGAYVSYLRFRSGGANMHEHERSVGRCVRLVKDY